MKHYRLNSHLSIDAQKALVVMTAEVCLYRRRNNLAIGNPSDWSGHVLSLLKHVRRITEADMDACNGVPDPKHPGCSKWDETDEQAADEARTDSMRQAVDALRHLFPSTKFTSVHEGDPRGCPIKVKFLDSGEEWRIDGGYQ